MVVDTLFSFLFFFAISVSFDRPHHWSKYVRKFFFLSDEHLQEYIFSSRTFRGKSIGFRRLILFLISPIKLTSSRNMWKFYFRRRTIAVVVTFGIGTVLLLLNWLLRATSVRCSGLRLYFNDRDTCSIIILRRAVVVNTRSADILQ